MDQSTYREDDSSLAGQQIPHLLWNPKSHYVVHSSLPLVPFVSRIYLCVISSFFREVDEMCALLGNYTAYSSNSLPMFRDNLSVTSSRVQKSWLGCLETSIRNYHYTLCNIQEKRSSHVNLVHALPPYFFKVRYIISISKAVT
jgi:hypothetical protein